MLFGACGRLAARLIPSGGGYARAADRRGKSPQFPKNKKEIAAVIGSSVFTSTPKNKKGTTTGILFFLAFPFGEGTDASISRSNGSDDGFIVCGGFVRF